MPNKHHDAKVLLVSPPIKRIRFNLSGTFPMQPLGIACLAAYLRERGVPVSILDAVALKYSNTQTLNEIIRQKPHLVGFSTTIFNIANTYSIIQAIKQACPDILTVIGGYGVVFSPDLLGSRLAEIDFFIKGEGEKPLYSLIEAMAGEGRYQDIPGLIWREDGVVRSNPPGQPTDINSLPLPALDLLPQANYAMHPPFNINPPLCLVETARGCGWHCNFCSLPRQLRQKSPARVIEEIKWAKNLYRANEIHFVDPTFPAGKDRFFDLATGLKRNFPKLSWSCKSRVELIDSDVAECLKDTGCYLVSLGVESGSQKMLDALNKGSTVNEIRTALRLLKKHGVRSLAYIMFGAIGETDETVRETMELLFDLKPDYALFAGLMPDPLSLLLKNISSGGSFTEEDVFNLYYNGCPQNTVFEKTLFTGLSTEKVNRWVKSAYMRYYFHPSYIMRRLFALTNLRDSRNLIVGGMLLLKEFFSFSSDE
jgi:radical SAM superfamily enzyme YgiQ (UPF0313 family)